MSQVLIEEQEKVEQLPKIDYAVMLADRGPLDLSKDQGITHTALIPLARLLIVTRACLLWRGLDH